MSFLLKGIIKPINRLSAIFLMGKSKRHSIQPFLRAIALFFLFSATVARAQYSLGSSVTFFSPYTVGPVNSGCQATVLDALSPDLVYVSCSGAPCSFNSGTVYWNLGTVSPGQSGSVTLITIADTCNSNFITDQKAIDYTSPPVTVYSNTVSFTIACLTNTPTVSPTLTSTFTTTLSPTVTGTPTYTFTATLTPTQTNTPTPTLSPTVTDTPTFTLSPTSTLTPTLTFTPTYTFSPTITSTPTITFTPTSTFTPTVSLTPTSTPVGLHLWPNPYNPNYAYNGTLKVYMAPPGAVLSIYTISGELVKTETVDANGWILWDGEKQVGGANCGRDLLLRGEVRGRRSIRR